MGDLGTGVSKGLNTWAGGVLVQCTYDGGNTRGMKWTCAACARRRFGLSGDDEAARVIADSNTTYYEYHDRSAVQHTLYNISYTRSSTD